jgi:predicted membrane GTPase involved in stress response
VTPEAVRIRKVVLDAGERHKVAVRQGRPAKA